jgi:hypothetical protein
LEPHTVSGEYFLTFKLKGCPETILWLTEAELRYLQRLIDAENL